MKTDNEPIYPIVSVDFCIRSYELNPTQVTAELGLQPSRSWAKGDKHLGKAFNPETKEVFQKWNKRSEGIWGIETKMLVSSKNVETHILHMLKLLEPKKAQIQDYMQRNGFVVRFHIWWEDKDGHGAYDISSELLRRMSELCQYLQLAIIVDGVVDD